MASVHEQILQTHRARLERVAEKRGVVQLKKIYQQAQSNVEAKLGRLTAGRRGDTFTAHVHNQVLGQLKQGQAMMARDMASGLSELSEEAQVESIRGLADDMTRLERHYTGAEVVIPVDEVSTMSNLVGARRSELDRMHQLSMARYGATVFGKMSEQIAVSLASGESNTAMVERVVDVAEVEWWQGERIVRTETSYAFNSAHADGIKEVAKEIDDMYMRWTEHVSDQGLPLDDRVGKDSIAMHGQVARPGRPFTMPDDDEVSDSLIGMSWYFPPNRPNDRATLSPWRPHWGIPGWKYSGGRVITLV